MPLQIALHAHVAPVQIDVTTLLALQTKLLLDCAFAEACGAYPKQAMVIVVCYEEAEFAKVGFGLQIWIRFVFIELSVF